MVLGVALLFWQGDAQALLLGWRERAGPVPFFVAMAVLPLLGVPFTPFFVVAGATFGIGIGLVGTFAALALNLLLSFRIASSDLRPWLERLLRRTPWDLPDLEEDRRRALRFALLMKLAPGVPAFIKHYAIALAGVPFAVYFLVSLGISAPYVVSFVVLGESLLSRDIGPGIAALALLVLASIGAWWWWWRSRRARGPD